MVERLRSLERRSLRFSTLSLREGDRRRGFRLRSTDGDLEP